MVLDIRSLLASNVASSVALLAVFVSAFYWRDKSVRGLGEWLVGYALVAAGMTLIALRGFLPDWICFFGAHSLLMLGALCAPLGVLRFLRRKPPFALLWTVFLLSDLAYLYAYALRPSLAGRIAAFSLGFAFACLYAAYELHRRTPPELRTRARLLGFSLVAQALVNLARVVVDLAVDPGRELLAGGAFEAGFILANMAAQLGVAFGQLQLVSGKYLAELGKAVAGRDLLAKELNHRMKNNLALVESLISLEEGRIEGQGAEAAAFRDILESLRTRIHSIELVHDRLYRVETGSRLRADEYLGLVAEAFVAVGSRIRLRTGLEALEIEPGMAVSLGIVLNELLTNAVKHGFPGDRGGTITVNLAERGGVATLTVRDDGVGASPGSGDGLGNLIVAALASQLRGTIAYRSEGGFTAELAFPLNPAA